MPFLHVDDRQQVKKMTQGTQERWKESADARNDSRVFRDGARTSRSMIRVSFVYSHGSRVFCKLDLQCAFCVLFHCFCHSLLVSCLLVVQSQKTSPYTICFFYIKKNIKMQNKNVTSNRPIIEQSCLDQVTDWPSNRNVSCVSWFSTLLNRQKLTNFAKDDKKHNCR